MEPIRRRVLSTALALLLAAESVTVVAAAAGTVLGAGSSATHPLPAATPAGRVLAEDGTAGTWEPAPLAAARPGTPPSRPADGVDNVLAARRALAGAPRADTAAPAASAKAAPISKSTTKSTASTQPKSATTTTRTTGVTKATAYTGRNHVWIPALGVSRSVSLFACTRSTPPANLVYRWGCAGANNVYLLGHAWGVFKPLHDAYVSGRLKTGMRVYYADASGRVRLYTVRWWRVTLPTGNPSWAWAAQSTPSMTLQTCVGANSQYRLIVRLVQAG